MAEADPPPSARDAPPDWLLAHAELLRRAARLGPVLDVACGRGRAAREARRLGARVLALDRDAAALRALREAAPGGDLLPVRADLEGGARLPVRPGSCGAVLVFRFLFRPLAPALAAALAPGGLLLYETFTRGQKDLPYGPSREAFLLAPGELPGLFPGLRVLAHEEGWRGSPRPFAVARLAAQQPPRGPG